LFDSYVLKDGGFIRLLKSTAFDEMSGDEWAVFWKKVLDAVHQKFLPLVDMDEVELEILRCLGEAA